MDSDLFQPYEKLVTIEVLGVRVEVPENNTLLRCFQFLSLKTISYGDFCWNGDCTNCQIWFQVDPAAPDPVEKPVLSCRTQVKEGMVITRMSPFVVIEGITRPTGC
jgi:NADH dehydrogenase/NADH:ubiquinone oxidoreductase subunit G